MQFELYAILSILLAFGTLTFVNLGIQTFALPDFARDNLHTPHSLDYAASQGFFIAFNVMDILLRINVAMVFFTYVVQALRFVRGKKVHYGAPNFFLCWSVIWSTILLFMLYYFNFVEFNSKYTPVPVDPNTINRAGSIVGMCLVAIVFWFILPVYILVQWTDFDIKLTEGRIVFTR